MTLRIIRAMTFDQEIRHNYILRRSFSQISIIISMIKVNDRATMLQSDARIIQFTQLCSGIICENLMAMTAIWCNKDERVDAERLCKSIIMKKNSILSKMAGYI